MPTSQSFSVEYPGRVNVLATECGIMAAFDPRTTPTPPGPLAQVGCIWDTGATGTAITQNLVDRLGLIPTGMAKVSTASGESTTSTYLINMVLPNGVGFAGVQATCCVLTPGIEVLVGMDVIGRGDFAISCSGGKTLMSFRTPPSKRIDFVQEHHADARNEATKALIKKRPNAKRKNKKRQ